MLFRRVVEFRKKGHGGRDGSAALLLFVFVDQSMAVDVEPFQDVMHIAHLLVGFFGPVDDIEVFFVVDELANDFVQERLLVGEFAEKKPEVVLVEFNPEA